MRRQPFRLPSGGRIDRSRSIRFLFDGRPFHGHPGDTVASALLASGEHLVARSFKYHRPRGLFAAGSEDPAGLVTVGNDPARLDPNTRATEQEIHDGLVVRPQNCWPSLRHDLGAVNDLLAPFIPAGFYYKTFMGPKGLGWPNWGTFEPAIRRAAGLGEAPKLPDPDRYESVNRHCDVLVVGGGPAGLSAALAAARSGARVILAEETPLLGGTLLSRDPADTRIDGRRGPDWVAEMEAALRAFPETLVLTRTSAFGYYADNFVGLWERVQDHLAQEARAGHLPRQRLWRVRARQVVLATGAIERPLVFHNNDRPGIMLAGSVRTFLHRYGVMPGRSAVVLTNNDSGWRAAFDMAGRGIEIMALVDIRRDPPGDLLAQAARLGLAIHAGSTVTDTSGRRRIRSVSVRRLSETGEGGLARGTVEIPCDLLAVSGGWMPNVALFAQSRGKLRYDEGIAAFRPGRSWQQDRSVGAANGVFSLSAALGEGARAGAEAAAAAGFAGEPVAVPAVVGEERGPGAIRAVAHLPSGRPAARTRAFVDLQDDVTVKDLSLAVDENFRSVEHMKRYTTMGMGTDQGKVSNLNAFALLAEKRAEDFVRVGTTTFRQPVKPVPFGALAGQHVGALFLPRRTTPMHGWHRERGAVFEPVGEWLRARAYCQAGESFGAAVGREVKAARTTIGLLDASTLGKIDVRGRDAREFLHRVYSNAWRKLPVGACRYGLMLGEDGMVIDDGVTACLADDHFHMTTTTGGAARVLATLEDYLQTEWTDLKVHLTTVTEEWAVASVSGPSSPALMAELAEGFDPDPERFAAMTWREGTVAGVPARVFRVSFSGETGYEVNVRARFGRFLWERLMAAGARHGITPYGTEAMHVLRAEKGFIIVGQETDGTVTPADLRLSGMIKKEGDFIGRRSLTRSDTARTDRRQLVGLIADDPSVVLKEGAHLVERASSEALPVPMLGHVTSSYFSPNLGRGIALALVGRGGARIGERLFVSRAGGAGIPVTVTETDFIALRDKGLLPAHPAAPLPSIPRGEEGGAHRQASAPHVPVPPTKGNAGSAPSPLSPLSNRTPLVAQGGLVRLAERPFLPKHVLKGAAPAELSPAPLRALDVDGVAVLWIGPEERLVVGMDPEREAMLRAALEGAHSQLVSVSDHFTAIVVEGRRARDLLAKLTVLDLHPRAFRPSEVRGSMFGHAQGFLWLHAAPDGAAPAFTLFVRRSYADYAWCVLAEAGREWGLPEQAPVSGEPMLQTTADNA